MSSSLADTQTGLRCIPSFYLNEIITLENNGFNYEFSCLIYFIKNHFLIIEEPIDTIYFSNNSNTRFKKFNDSFSIIKTFFNY